MSSVDHNKALCHHAAYAFGTLERLLNATLLDMHLDPYAVIRRARLLRRLIKRDILPTTNAQEATLLCDFLMHGALGAMLYCDTLRYCTVLQPLYEHLVSVYTLRAYRDELRAYLPDEDSPLYNGQFPAFSVRLIGVDLDKSSGIDAVLAYRNAPAERQPAAATPPASVITGTATLAAIHFQRNTTPPLRVFLDHASAHQLPADKLWECVANARARVYNSNAGVTKHECWALAVDVALRLAQLLFVTRTPLLALHCDGRVRESCAQNVAYDPADVHAHYLDEWSEPLERFWFFAHVPNRDGLFSAAQAIANEKYTFEPTAKRLI